MTENKIRNLIRDELRKFFDKSSELISKENDNRKNGEIIKTSSKKDNSIISPKKNNRKQS